MNGYDLAVEVRKQLGHSIKLVAMSGYGQPEDVRKAEACGFDRHSPSRSTRSAWRARCVK
jgi:CheY-like chemotaxis protein